MDKKGKSMGGGWRKPALNCIFLPPMIMRHPLSLTLPMSKEAEKRSLLKCLVSAKQPGPQSSCPQCSLSHTPLTSRPTVSWFPCELRSVGALLQCEIPGILAKGAFAPHCTHYPLRSSTTSMISASFTVPWWAPNAYVCLLTSTGWISHVHLKLRMSKTELTVFPHKICSSFCFPYFCEWYHHPPSCPSQKQGHLPNLLPFSPCLHQGDQKAGQLAWSPIRHHSFPLRFHFHCPGSHPHPSSPGPLKQCPNQSPFPRLLTHENHLA